jgi:putative phage-type endonuclease
MSRNEWLEARRNGIGGSDAAAVMGLNPYRSPIDVYLDKTGATPIDNDTQTEAAYWGTVLEEPIAKRFAELHPELRVQRNNHILTSEDYPFMFANLDREIHSDNGGIKGLEIKTVGNKSARLWEDDSVPVSYVCQVQHYMKVTGWTEFTIAALIGGQTYIERTITRDETIIAQLVKAETDFWHHVETNQPPEWDGSESAWKALKSMYPTAIEGSSVDLSPELALTANNLKHADAEVKSAKDYLKSMERNRDVYKQQLAAAMGNAERGYLGKNYVVTYKTTTVPEKIVPSYSFRTLRIKEMKELTAGGDENV